MNARQAAQENERLVNELLNSSKEFAERKCITIEEAIDFKVLVMIKYAKNDNEKAAIEIRCDKVKGIVALESEAITLSTERELKIFVKNNRKNIIEINGLKFNSMYPILEVSNSNAMYYDVDIQANKLILPPFIIKTK